MSIEYDKAKKFACLFGSPVAHSISPAMHNYSFEKLGIDAKYYAVDVNADGLEDVMKDIRVTDFLGANVTMPLKTEIIKYLDRLDISSQLAGAVNTIVPINGQLVGYTTDGAGFVDSLREIDVDVEGKDILILGAGGAATVIILILFVFFTIGAITFSNNSPDTSISDPEEIEYFGKKGPEITKASRRDLAMLCAKGEDGACTVTTTMMIAHMAGIKIFATGGIGGVHRGAEITMDISADLEELAQTPVMVVCAGCKSILDIGLTLEYLETKGVPVIGFGTEDMPAFYTTKSGFKVDYKVDSPAELANFFKTHIELGMKGGILVGNPIPEEYAMDPGITNPAIYKAIEECNKLGIKGKATTPFLLAKVKEITGGDSLDSNIRLVFNNAKVAAQTACELFK